MNILRPGTRAGLAAAMSLLAACESTPSLFETTTADTAQDAAHVYVAAYPAVPWGDIAEKIEPKHNLTTDAARGIAAVTTQAQVSQFLSTFSAGLGLGLPTRTYTQTTTTTNGVDQATTTRSQGSGTVPGSSGTAANAIGEATLAADVAKTPPALGLDASTLLTAGTAVYQLAQILDNQVSKAFYPSGYHAHLLTFQVALQPKMRTHAYDVYVNLSLHPASWKEALAASADVHGQHGAPPPVVVYPLVISDAMETASTARSVEVVRQAAVQLSGILGRLGTNASAAAGTDNLDAVIGQTRNSIVTVGRISDHAIRVRLGAQHSGRSGFAMVPRTHNISLVVFTRWPLADSEKSKRVTNLSVFADTEIRPVDGGAPLRNSPERSRAELAKKVSGLVTAFRFSIQPACSGDTARDPSRELEYPLDLLRAVARQDYKNVQNCLGVSDDPKLGDRIRLERLLAELIQVQANALNSTMFVALRPAENPALPPRHQLVTMTKEENALSVTVRGGTALRVDQLSAVLNLNGGKPPVIARAVALRDRGAEITASFPPIAELGINDPDVQSLTLNAQYDPSSKAVAQTYPIAKVVPGKKEAKSNGSLLSVTQPVLVPDKDGVARLAVTIGELKKPPAAPLRLQVAGADLREELGGAKVTQEGMEVQQKTVARLLLGNLTPLRPVTVSIMSKDPKTKKDAKVGEAITLQVAR